MDENPFYHSLILSDGVAKSWALGTFLINYLYVRKVLRGLVKNAIIFFLCVKLIEFTFYDEIYIAILHHSSPINRMCCVCVMKRFDCGNDLNCSVKFNFVQICPAYIYI